METKRTKKKGWILAAGTYDRLAEAGGNPSSFVSLVTFCKSDFGVQVQTCPAQAALTSAA
jgi:hypothetical protein